MTSADPCFQAVTCDYGCIFGISNPSLAVKPGEVHYVYRPHSSFLILGGRHSRLYWFYFFNAGNRVNSSHIPRYTKKDEKTLVDKISNDPVLPGLTFGDIYKQKVSSSMTALPEYIYKNGILEELSPLEMLLTR